MLTTVLFASSKEELQNRIEKWANNLKRYDLKVNLSKTEIMLISNETEKVEIVIEDKKIQAKQQLKYLGALVEETGKIEQEIPNRIKKVIATYGALYTTFFNKKEVTKMTKTRVYESVLVPMLTYGCESWVLTDSLKKSIEACEMKILRKIEGVSRMDKIKSETIRNNLKIKSVLLKIETQQLRWFGHLTRMEEQRTTKVIWETVTGNSKRRGRPRKTWNSVIANILKKKDVTWNQARTKATDRNVWKKFITSTPLVEEVTG